jgi:hypothetical protein
MNSNPNTQSYSYRISVIDTCHQESDTSAYQTTITLLAAYNSGTNTYGFTWSAYQGLTVANYYLYGITSGDVQTLIDSVPGNHYIYDYINPNPIYVKYFVGFNTQVCNGSGSRLTVTTYHLVKSNFIQSTTGIEENTAINNSVSIYPNPATNNLTIESPQSATIEITNIQGQLIETLTTTSNKTNVDVTALPSGVYIVQVKTEKGIAVGKFIKE